MFYNNYMVNYNSVSEIRSLLESEGLGMQKKFGQNFLINQQIRQKLVDILGAQEQDEVWEIGSGIGAMTSLLLDKGLKVKAFEIDRGFIRILKKLFYQRHESEVVEGCESSGSFELIEGDVLKTWKTQKQTPFLLGNLPYNVAAVLLADLIENRCIFTRMVVTVQKETALRMAATAGSPDYSSFSVLCASAYKVKQLMLIHSSSFYPQPNVDSMGVLLEKREELLCPAVFYPLVRSLFSSRRKTIKNNLTSFITSKFPGKTAADIVSRILQECGLGGNERAEQLELEIFLSLAKSIHNMRL